MLEDLGFRRPSILDGYPITTVNLCILVVIAFSCQEFSLASGLCIDHHVNMETLEKKFRAGCSCVLLSDFVALLTGHWWSVDCWTY